MNKNSSEGEQELSGQAVEPPIDALDGLALNAPTYVGNCRACKAQVVDCCGQCERCVECCICYGEVSPLSKRDPMKDEE